MVLACSCCKRRTLSVLVSEDERLGPRRRAVASSTRRESSASRVASAARSDSASAAKAPSVRRSSASAAAMRSANDAASSSRWRSNSDCACRWRASRRCCPASPVCESRSAKTVSAWRTNDLDGAVELARQPHRGLLARGAHRRLELLAGRLGVALGLTRDHALELLDLPALDVCERRLDPACRLALAPLDLLGQRLLAPPQPLGDLLDHAAALARVRFELLERLGDGRLRGPLELLPQPQHGRALLLGGGHELRRLRLDSRLGLGDQLLLALLELAQLRLQVLLRAVEVVRPRAEALVDAACRSWRARRRAARRRRARAPPARGGARPRSSAPPWPGSRASPRACARAASSAPLRSPPSPRRRGPSAAPAPPRATGRGAACARGRTRATATARPRIASASAIRSITGPS